MSRESWPAPAKINLFLHVVGRRTDGYHCLQTVFRFLDHGDSLAFTITADPAVVMATPLPGVPADSDLCVRAARLLQAFTGTRQGVTITLNKRLPMGGGLGGGSSDAATVLLALNQLWQTNVPRKELEKLGLQLGADVPIFVHGHAAFAEGVGEQFTDVKIPDAWYLVLVPPVSAPTPAIFAAPDLVRNTPAIAPAQWQHGFGHNDLQAVACRLYPAIAEYLDLLRPYAEPRMTGSGACVFAEFASQDAALAAQQQIPVAAQSFVARGLDQHPLLQDGLD